MKQCVVVYFILARADALLGASEQAIFASLRSRFDLAAIESTGGAEMRARELVTSSAAPAPTGVEVLSGTWQEAEKAHDVRPGSGLRQRVPCK